MHEHDALDDEAVEARHRRRWTRRRVVGVIVGLVVLLVAVGLIQLCREVRPEIPVTTTNDASPPPATTDDGRPLGPDEQQLLTDIRSLRTRLLQGELVIDWPPVGPGEDPGEVFGSFGSADEALSYLEAELLSHPSAAVIYLNDTVDAETAERLLREVEGFPGVTEVTYISKDVALTRLREELKDHPEILDSLDQNPLPASIEVYVEEAGVVQRLARAMDRRPGVDETRFPTLTPTENIRTIFEHLRDRAQQATES